MDEFKDIEEEPRDLNSKLSFFPKVESQTGQATIFLKDLVKNIKKDAVVILVIIFEYFCSQTRCRKIVE